ncbi:MAG: RNA ligase (ATP), partial [Bacteroidia bacterium]|nr:RNA ligase (ATP) [Bacteroidia bacterium]
MRIRTVRLRGQISQGICFPLSILPEGTLIEENVDVTEILGIEKFEAPVPANLGGVAKGMFPGFIPKTDETRVQVLQDVLDFYSGEICYVTEKLDGSSSTIYLRDEVFGVCSRNLDLVDDGENSMWKFVKENNLEEKLRSFGKNIALQGEIIGEGIQKNKYKLRGQSIHFFNVFDIDKFEYFSFEEFCKTISGFGLQIVPVLEENFILTNSISSLIEKSKMRSTLNKDTWAEGIVIRPLKENFDKKIMKGRVSFKAINPEFLIKHGE